MIGNVIVWIVLGAVIGWLTAVFIGNISSNSDNQRVVSIAGVGIVGAVAAGAIYSFIDTSESGFSWWSQLIAILGAFVLLFLAYYVVWRHPS